MIKVFCTRVIPALVFLLALFLGWLATFPNPEGRLFTLLIPASKFLIPPYFKEYSPCPVPELPKDDFITDPRPSKELFVTLPGLPTPPEGEELSPELVHRHQIPQQGIGMCCRPTAYDPESVRRSILWYLKQGGRHIDTADLYLNHEWIGDALQVAMRDYGIPRHEIFVTTKHWPRSYGTNATLEAIPRMLQELQLDYIDMVLLHFPVHQLYFFGAKTECQRLGLDDQECRGETWKALSTFRESGQVRHIGVSNFNVQYLQELQALNVAPIANNQFMFNPWAPDAQYETYEYCQQHGISVTAYSSFSGTMMQHAQAFTVEALQSIAKTHDTTVPQILLKWALQKGVIVIPGTGNPKHMMDNLNAYNVELSEDELQTITDLRRDESAKQFFFSTVDKI